MKLFSLGIATLVALFGVACDKHSASELDGVHGEGAHSAATQHGNSGTVQPGSKTHAPVGVPTNPAGSGPVDPHPAPRHTDGAVLHEPGPKFFPGKSGEKK